MQMIVEHGAATWQDMPYNTSDFTTWPAQAVWKSALSYRAQSAGVIDLSYDSGITALKQQLANGDLAVIAIDLYAGYYQNYPTDFAGSQNNGVMFNDSGAYYGGHALTVVGYDDNKSYNDGTGVKYGAFKIVNSWGSGWGLLDADAGTNGFMWISYTYMKNKSWQQAWTMVDRAAYQPSVYGTFGLKHAKRGDLNLFFTGGNDPYNPDWSFNALPNLGGNQAIDQNIVVDLSSYDPDFNSKFWLKVNDSTTNADTGQLTFMSVHRDGDAERISTDTPRNTLNGATVYVQLYDAGLSTVLNPSFTQVNISSLTAAWNSIPGASYTAVLSSSSDYSAIVSSSTSASNARTFTGLLPGGRYYFQVKISTEADAAYAYNTISTATPAGTWSSAGDMAAQREAPSATLLPNGKVLVTGGYNGSCLSSAELYDQNTNAWSSAGTMSSARNLHTATLLPGGKVLVAGGYSGSAYLSSAQLYDPDANAWSSAGAMSAARYNHTATLLRSGKVLVTGGYSASGYLSSAELYDPDTNAWSSAGAMSSSRYAHTATLLPGGKVLAAGGYNGAYLSSAELYDPDMNIWSGAASMFSARDYYAAAPLANGKVLVAGGNNGEYLSSAELYDPDTNAWSAAGAMSSVRYVPTATLLSNGKVLLAGGYASSFLSSAEVYDPETDSWASAGSMASARYSHTAALLPNGKALVMGGSINDGAWYYFYAAEVFSYYDLKLTSLNPSFTQNDPSGLTAAWTAAPCADYTVALSSDAAFMNIISSGRQSGNSAAFAGLTTGTRYFFEVRISTEADWAYAGNIISTTAYIQPGAPPVPGFFVGITSNSATIKWTWQDNAANETGYRIVASTGGAISPDLSPDTTWWFETGLSSGTAYSRRAVAFNGVNSSSSTDAAATTWPEAWNEDFETGALTLFPWATYGNAPWAVQTGTAVSGALAARSGAITHSQSSTLDLTLELVSSGTVRFYRKVSSESGYDFLKFYLDGVLQGGWSGETAWSQASYPVTSSGTHTFRWVYSKDAGGGSGSDAAWLDAVQFPSYNPVFPPTALTGTALSSTTIKWTWQDNAGNETGYRILSSTDGVISPPLAADTTWWIETGLSPETAYSRKAAAFNAVNASSSAVSAAATWSVWDEDFEAGVSFPWLTYGNAAWALQTGTAVSGAYSAGPDALTHYQYSALDLTLELVSSGTVRFYRKVSSQEYSDYLRFYLDGAEAGSWSGEAAWALASYPVTSSGTHTFGWVYFKDAGGSSGSDTAWIDAVKFPSYNPVFPASSFSGEALNSTTIKWTWRDNLAGETGYRIVSSTDGLISPPLAPDTTYWIETGLSPDAAYSRKVVVFSGVNSSSSAVASATTLYIPDEDFETGDLTLFPWATSGSLPWAVIAGTAVTGTYSARSGAITHSQSSTLELTRVLVTSGTVKFYRKVSCESGYDLLRFYIDDVPLGSWSGETAWARVSYPVTSSGTHTFRWVYSKDAVDSGGSDTAWLDAIAFPAGLLPEAPPFTAVSTDSVTASWASSYPVGTVYYGQSSTGAFPNTFAGNRSSATLNLFAELSGLVPNTTHYFRVSAAPAGPFMELGSTSTLANVPVDAAAGAIEVSSIALTWNAAGNPGWTRYLAQISANDFATVSSASWTLSVSATFQALTPNTTYYTRVYAVNNNGVATSFAVIPATMTRAAEPLAGEPSGVSSFSITANWGANGNPAWTRYRAEISSDGFAGAAGSSDTLNAHAAFTGLLIETDYELRVRSYGADGRSTAWVTLPSARTLLAPPGQAGTVFPAVGVSSATVQWTDGVNKAGTRYLCQVSTNNFATLNFTSSTYALSAWFGAGGAGADLRANTAHYFRVRATNGVTSTADVPLGSTVTLAYAPGSATVLAVTSAAVSLDWPPNGNPEPGTSYQVWRDTGSDFTAPVKITASSSTLSVNGLLPKTTYYFKVRTANLAGVFTDFNAGISTKTYPAPPGAVTTAGAVLGFSSITWTWNDVNDEDGYRVLSSTGGNMSGVLAAEVTAWTEINLSTNTAYSRKAVAFNISGVSPSALVPLYTLAAPPTGFVLTEIYFTSIAVRWAAGTNPSGTRYEVSYWAAGGSTTTLAAVTATSAALTGLADIAAVYARVRALNGDNVPTSEAELTLSSATMVTLLPNEGKLITFLGPSGEIKFDIPAYSFGETIQITVRTPAAPDCHPPAGGMSALATPVCVEIALDKALQPARNVGVSMSYLHADLGGLDENKLILAYYDEAHAAWVPLFSGRDTAGNKVTGKTAHFSLFQILRSNPSQALSNVTIGPNILRPGRYPGQLMTFRNLSAGAKVSIYTFVGELVYDTAEDGTGTAVWNGKNTAGTQAASGVYIALIEAGGKKRVFRVAVER